MPSTVIPLDTHNPLLHYLILNINIVIESEKWKCI